MSYSTEALVTNAARNIEVSSGRTATMTPANVSTFLGEADAIIDSHLSVLYYTPLRQVTRNGTTKYPDPIPYISTRLAAGLAVRAVYSATDNRASESAKEHIDDAMKELKELVSGTLVGSRFLDGQSRKAKNSFVNPNIAPHDPTQSTGF